MFYANLLWCITITCEYLDKTYMGGKCCCRTPLTVTVIKAICSKSPHFFLYATCMSKCFIYDTIYVLKEKHFLQISF